MPKKKKLTKKIKEPIISKEERFVLIIIENTQKNIRNDGSDLDSLFKGQLERLNKRLEEVRKC